MLALFENIRLFVLRIENYSIRTKWVFVSPLERIVLQYMQDYLRHLYVICWSTKLSMYLLSPHNETTLLNRSSGKLPEDCFYAWKAKQDLLHYCWALRFGEGKFLSIISILLTRSFQRLSSNFANEDRTVLCVLQKKKKNGKKNSSTGKPSTTKKKVLLSLFIPVQLFISRLSTEGEMKIQTKFRLSHIFWRALNREARSDWWRWSHTAKAPATKTSDFDLNGLAHQAPDRAKASHWPGAGQKITGWS